MGLNFDDVVLRKGRRKYSTFQPNHETCETAIKKFLKSGGKITKIHPPESIFHNFHNTYRSDHALNMSDLPEMCLL